MKPYEPPKLPLDCINWVAHIPLLGHANAAVARYDGLLRGIVNPLVLLSPLTTKEAVLSSRIEGTQASIEEVLEYEASPETKATSNKHEDIREIINYRRAMGMAVEEMQKCPMCLNTIKALHAILLDSARGRNKSRGFFRKSQNYIGAPGCSIEEATFIPPAWERVEEAMGNWEGYWHFPEKDHLVQLAVAKAQFELIHPFLDGNGRLGRMLVPLFLFDKQLLSSPMFYISEYLEKNRDAYYQRLGAISKNNDWDGWISFFLTALKEQAESNSAKTTKIIELYAQMKSEVQKIIRSQYLVETIDTLFERPIFSSNDFISKTKIPKASSLRILNALKTAGIVRDLRRNKGRRAAVLVFSKLTEITEE